MLRDGKLEIKDPHDKKPELMQAKELIGDMSKKFEMGSMYSKPDYFVPIPVVEGMASSEAFSKSGI